ncbi:MAG: hypothetical protein IJ551_10850 [Prevotella sp.]|nr:hypothetical protein [Prevotella sp.]
MMNEEQYIKSRLGDRNPFRVPEGYFDSFTAELMQKLPEQQKPALMVRLRPWLYAAACLFVALFTATVYFVAPDRESSVQVAAAAPSDTYVEDAADYVMADNIDIYACLASDY